MTGRRPRVLIVEDDPDLLVILRVNLESVGMDTLLAGDGRTALTRIESERPDLIVLDVMLPGVDGWTVLETIRARHHQVPVIVCSAKRHSEDIARARALGAVGYIVKPFDIERLVDDAVRATSQSGGDPEFGVQGEPGLDPA
jgi:DNA-binding response OmpR family regulator